MSGPTYIHANALIVGEAGVLLRGPSGAGKSALTLELVALAEMQGHFARLVGDDRVSVEARNGRLIVRPHPAIAGLIEARGRGIIGAAYEPACVARIVIDLVARDQAPPRDPGAATKMVEIAGIELPRIVENAFAGAASIRIFSYIQSVMTN